MRRLSPDTQGETEPILKFTRIRADMPPAEGDVVLIEKPGQTVCGQWRLSDIKKLLKSHDGEEGQPTCCTLWSVPRIKLCQESWL